MPRSRRLSFWNSLLGVCPSRHSLPKRHSVRPSTAGLRARVPNLIGRRTLVTLERLEDRTLLAADMLMATEVPGQLNYNLMQYTEQGSLVTSQRIPQSPTATGYQDAQGLAVDPSGNVHIIDSTFLDTYSPGLQPAWSYQTTPNLSGGGDGEDAAYKNYVFTPATAANVSSRGILRFDTSGGAPTLFASGTNAYDVTLALDGNLYEFVGSGGEPYPNPLIDVYNPDTLALVRSFHLSTPFDSDIRSIAVDGSGNVYAADWEGTVTKYDPSGAPLKSQSGYTENLMNIAIDNDGTIAVGGRNGGVYLTDESLDSLQSFQTNQWNAFVTFDHYIGTAPQTVAPTVTVAGAGAVYTGLAYAVTGASVVGQSGIVLASLGDPTLSYSYYQGTLTATQIATATPLADAPTNVGNYTVVAHFTSDIGPYTNADSAPTPFSITPAPLKYTIANDRQAYGGQANLATDLRTTISTGVNNETLDLAYASTGDTTTANVADYPIIATLSNGSGLLSNYTVTLNNGTLTVTPAALTITAEDQSKLYGAALPTLTASYSGFLNGDTAASLTTPPTLSTTATAGSHVSGSPYAITASGAVDPDYTISDVAGSLAITPAPLTITADDQSKVYGAALPTLTASYSGFVNGDNANVVSGAASLSATATSTSAVGSYPIIAALGTLSADDYQFTFQNGTLTVTSSRPFGVTDAVYTIGSGSVSVSVANGLLANDTGPSQLIVTAGTATGAQGGTFTINADGSFTYTPAANFPGYDNAQFTVTDASGDTGTATVNVLSQHAAVVWKFYESVLNRKPDPSGLQYWTNYFDNGGLTGQMAVGFFESTELLDKIITNYYQQYLLRTPDASGLSYWVSQWQATGEPEGIKAEFADSPEFFNSSDGTPQSWLAQLYQRILQRTPDLGGYQFWLNYYQQRTAAGVAAGAVEQQIALDFFDSSEAYGDDVTGWFQVYLFRAPTSAEQTQYVDQMQSGATDRTIEQEITNLPEYASNPAAPADGTAAPLPDYYQTPTSSAQSQAVLAAKDALFARL